jgi:hypothetical protein
MVRYDDERISIGVYALVFAYLQRNTYGAIFVRTFAVKPKYKVSIPDEVNVAVFDMHRIERVQAISNLLVDPSKDHLILDLTTFCV